jgi:hypothetical protein
LHPTVAALLFNSSASSQADARRVAKHDLILIFFYYDGVQVAKTHHHHTKTQNTVAYVREIEHFAKADQLNSNPSVRGQLTESEPILVKTPVADFCAELAME